MNISDPIEKFYIHDEKIIKESFYLSRQLNWILKKKFESLTQKMKLQLTLIRLK